MNQTPQFSVIMPTFNREQFLAEAINSVIAQTYQAWELILVDDGSSDQSPEIIRKFCRQESRIRAVRQPNRKISAARNVAISLASAPWLCYLDSDDFWLPTTLQHYHDYLAAHPQARFIYGYRHRIRAGTITYLTGRHQATPTGPRELFRDMYLTPICVCHARPLLELVGGFDENINTGEDYDLFWRMGRQVAFEPIGVATGVKRRHGNNTAQQTGYNLIHITAVVMRFLDQYGGREIVPPNEVATRLGRLFYATAREYFRARCFTQCLETLALGQSYAMPWKSRAIGLLARLLKPWGRHDGKPCPIPLAPPRWNLKTPSDIQFY